MVIRREKDPITHGAAASPGGMITYTCGMLEGHDFIVAKWPLTGFGDSGQQLQKLRGTIRPAICDLVFQPLADVTKLTIHPGDISYSGRHTHDHTSFPPSLKNFTISFHRPPYLRRCITL